MRRTFVIYKDARGGGVFLIRTGLGLRSLNKKKLGGGGGGGILFSVLILIPYAHVLVDHYLLLSR
jgi:hypothetical protein